MVFNENQLIQCSMPAEAGDENLHLDMNYLDCNCSDDLSDSQMINTARQNLLNQSMSRKKARSSSMVHCLMPANPTQPMTNELPTTSNQSSQMILNV